MESPTNLFITVIFLKKNTFTDSISLLKNFKLSPLLFKMIASNADCQKTQKDIMGKEVSHNSISFYKITTIL